MPVSGHCWLVPAIAACAYPLHGDQPVCPVYTRMIEKRRAKSPHLANRLRSHAAKGQQATPQNERVLDTPPVTSFARSGNWEAAGGGTPFISEHLNPCRKTPKAAWRTAPRAIEATTVGSGSYPVVQRWRHIACAIVPPHNSGPHYGGQCEVATTLQHLLTILWA